MNTQKQVTVHELLQLRGDMAVSGLKAIQMNLHELLATLDTLLDEMKKLDAHYSLVPDTTEGSPLDALVGTLRRMSPENTSGLSDEEILAKFGPKNGGQ